MSICMVDRQTDKQRHRQIERQTDWPSKEPQKEEKKKTNRACTARPFLWLKAISKLHAFVPIPRPTTPIFPFYLRSKHESNARCLPCCKATRMQRLSTGQRRSYRVHEGEENGASCTTRRGSSDRANLHHSLPDRCPSIFIFFLSYISILSSNPSFILIACLSLSCPF